METIIKGIQRKVNSLMYVGELAAILFNWAIDLASMAKEKEVKEKSDDRQGSNNRSS